MNGKTLLDECPALKPLCHSHLLQDQPIRCVPIRSSLVKRRSSPIPRAEPPDWSSAVSDALSVRPATIHVLRVTTLQLGQTQHHQHTQGIRNHTRIQHPIERPIGSIRLNSAVLVNEFIGENE